MKSFSLAVLALAAVARAQDQPLESTARALLDATPRFIRTTSTARNPISVSVPPVKGRADAPMTLTLFGNFACPNTARLVRYQVAEELLRRHPTTMRLVFRHFSKPHPEGIPAAQRWNAVRRIAPESTWAYFDGLYDCRLALDLTHSCMSRLESRLRLDSTALDAAVARYSSETRAAQEADDAAAASNSVSATPTLMLDGVLLFEGAPGPACPAGDDVCAARLAQAFRSFTDMLDAEVQARERNLGLAR